MINAFFFKEITAEYSTEGDLEHMAMQQIARDNHLRALKYTGERLTLNIAKDLIRIQEYMKNPKKRE